MTKIIEHTSDVGLEGSGRNLDELFADLAEGMFSLATDLTKVKSGDKVQIALQADSPETLLVDWLSELIYLADVRGMLFSSFAVRVGNRAERREKGWSLTATIGGEKFQADRHERKMMIKAVTYHQLEVKQVAAGYEGRVIFDV